jgi:hypothetical protein
MDITFFYTQKQLDAFRKSRFASSILYPQGTERQRALTGEAEDLKDVLSPQLETILEQIEETKKIVDPVIDKYILSIQDENLLDILRHSDNFSGWREKTFLVRVSLLALECPFTDPLVKAACAIELLGRGACLLDDLIDETLVYESRETTWAKYGLKEAICAYEALRSLFDGGQRFSADYFF